MDKESGEILSKYACFDLENWDGNITNSTEIISIGPCITALEVIENPDAEIGQSKGALYITTAKNTVVRSEIFAESYVNTTQVEEDIGFHRYIAEWVYPPIDLDGRSLVNNNTTQTHYCSLPHSGAVMIELEENIRYLQRSRHST